MREGVVYLPVAYFSKEESQVYVILFHWSDDENLNRLIDIMSRIA